MDFTFKENLIIKATSWEYLSYELIRAMAPSIALVMPNVALQEVDCSTTACMAIAFAFSQTGLEPQDVRKQDWHDHWHRVGVNYLRD